MFVIKKVICFGFIVRDSVRNVKDEKSFVRQGGRFSKLITPAIYFPN